MPAARLASFTASFIRMPAASATASVAITVSPALYAELNACADGDLADPLVSARALARMASRDETRTRPCLT